MDPMPRDCGWIEVVTGCMYSGKTEELIRRLRRAMYARLPVVVFKPAIDDRYSEDSVGSHSGMQLRSIQVSHPGEIIPNVGEAKVVGIDEAQFLGMELVDICEELANRGLRVIVAGLDQDYRGEPFEPIPQLLARAEYITKNLAICMVCGNPADRSQRLVKRDSRIVVGTSEMYEARCRLHWSPDATDPEQSPLPLGANLADR